MVKYDEDLPIECYKYAEEHLSETPEIRDQSVKEIMLWLDENPIINANRNLVIILYFLRATKFKLENTKRKIKK